MKNINVNEDVFVKVRNVIGRVYAVPGIEDCNCCPKSCKDCNIKPARVQVYVGGSNTLIDCMIVDIEPVASTVYKIGDKVTSTLGGGFVGTVTGFEHDTNRVICKSDKDSSNNRTRYAYGVTEIKPYEVIRFKLGDKFRINDKQQIIIMGGQNAQSEYCNIYNYQTNKLMWSNVQLTNTVEVLNSKYNIHKMERIEG